MWEKNTILQFIFYLIIIIMIFAYTFEANNVVSNKLLIIHKNPVMNLFGDNHYKATPDDLLNYNVMYILCGIVLVINYLYITFSKKDLENKLFYTMIFNFIILLIIIICADNIYYNVYDEHLSVTMQYIRGLI